MVVATAPANGNRIESLTKPPSLWGDLDIPVIVGTGPFGSGKTTFGITICPGPETLVYDNEGSSLTFRSLGFDHVDMSKELRDKFGEKFRPQDRYTWWREHIIARGKTGKYRVAVVDPASELEDGLSDYIKTHVGEFGMTAEQMKKSSGLFWGAMKSEWKKTLDLLRTYFETVYLTVHLRTKYIGNTPTNELEPKGKETLHELASLFLWFEKVEGTACPAAKVEKTRLSKFVMVDGEMTPVAVLPPRLPRATPKAIRDYIANPPNYAKLKKDEKVQEKTLSEDERLALQAQIAANTKEAAEAELTKMQMLSEEARRQQERADALRQSPDQSANHAASTAEKVNARALEPIRQHTLDQIIKLLDELFATTEEKAAFCQPRLQAAGAERVSKMTDPQGEGLISDLLALKSSKQQEALVARGKELQADSPMGKFTPPADDAPFEADPPPAVKAAAPAEQPGPTPAQLAEFQSLVPLAFDADKVGAQCPALILKHGAPRAGLLTPTQCEAMLVELRAMVAARQKPAEAAAPLATPEQIERLRGYATRLGWSGDAQLKWFKDRGIDAIALQKEGINPFTRATAADVDSRLEEFMQIELGFKGGMPGN